MFTTLEAFKGAIDSAAQAWVDLDLEGESDEARAARISAQSEMIAGYLSAQQLAKMHARGMSRENVHEVIRDLILESVLHKIAEDLRTVAWIMSL